MELLTWPVSEDLIGRKVKCLENICYSWAYAVGDVYTIGRDCYGSIGPVDVVGNAPSEHIFHTIDELFSFELLPEEEAPPITTTIDPSLIPEGYEFVRIGEAEYGEVYVGFEHNQYRTPSPVTAQTNTCCVVVVIRKVEPKTKTMYNIHTGEPVEVPYDLTHNTTSATLTQSLGMKTLNVSLGFSSKEPFKHFADELFTNEGKDLGV
jgi:hypothetical protein